jgi:hypothetical protein
MTNHEKIIELNKIWYRLIAGDHHKDRDCHFRINTHYFYGDHVEYEVEHHGYILRDIDVVEFGTLEDAQNYLIEQVLKKGIIEEATWYINLPKPETMGCHDEHPTYSRDELEEIVTKVLSITNH